MKLLLSFALLASVNAATISRSGSLDTLVHSLKEDADSAHGDVWAVLVAGNNEWYNYRHQADISHAYQIIRLHGIAADHIITLMYDDIANSSDNQWPGTLFNNQLYHNNYLGVKVDYRGKDVTSDNFLGVLRGASTGTGKPVLKSTANDRVFVYFADHGGVGIIAFPDGDVLTAKSLDRTLGLMHKRNMYSKLVFYVEACESGSMFEGILTPDRNIFALTASWANESSYGVDCENSRNLPCLGDEFSVAWMADSDRSLLSTKKTSLVDGDVRRDGESIHVDCHHEVATAFARECVNVMKNTHALRFMRVLNNLCSIASSEEILTVFASSCGGRI